MKKTGAVIFAAGMSSRMGEFKPMLPFGNSSVARHMINMLQAFKVDPIVVVTGYRSEELQKHLLRMGVRFLKNERYQTTRMFDSVKLGIESIQEECDRLLILPVDVPAILPETIGRLLSEAALAARPICHGEPGYPILLSAEAARQLGEYRGSGELCDAIEHCLVPMKTIEVEDEGVCRDMDTWEQYQKLLEWNRDRENRSPIFPQVQLRFKTDESFYGPGVQQLLSEIHKTGSLQEACINMNLSYSKGSKMIRNLERHAGVRVVERYAGGIGGGGSRLTEKGMELLQKYQRMVSEIQMYAETLYQEYFGNEW